MLASSLSPEELAFVAEDSLTVVVPTVPMEQLSLLSGVVGPLVPQVPASVPLWLAIYLARRNRARLRAPDWLDKDKLETLLAQERANPDAFGVLPSDAFVETASLFFEHGKESLADPERVRQLVEAIVECRKGKVLAGLSTLAGPTVLVKLDNLTRLELNVLRPFLLKSLKQFDVLAPPEERQ